MIKIRCENIGGEDVSRPLLDDVQKKDSFFLMSSLTWAGVLEPTCVSSSYIICGDVVNNEYVKSYLKQI